MKKKNREFIVDGIIAMNFVKNRLNLPLIPTPQRTPLLSPQTKMVD